MTHQVRVARYIAHRLRLHAQHLYGALAERRFVPLPLVLRPHQQGNPATRIEADLGTLFVGVSKRPAGDLDGIDQGDAAQHAARRGLGTPLIEAREIRRCERSVHVLFELAAVVDEQEAGIVRHRRFRDQVAPPQLDTIYLELLSSQIDHPLHGKGRLGPPRPAIGRRRLRVGVDALHLGMDVRRRVDPR